MVATDTEGQSTAPLSSRCARNGSGSSLRMSRDMTGESSLSSRHGCSGTAQAVCFPVPEAFIPHVSGQSLFLAARFSASIPESLDVHAVVLGVASGARGWIVQARNAQRRTMCSSRLPSVAGRLLSVFQYVLAVWQSACLDDLNSVAEEEWRDCEGFAEQKGVPEACEGRFKAPTGDEPLTNGELCRSGVGSPVACPPLHPDSLRPWHWPGRRRQGRLQHFCRDRQDQAAKGQF